MKKILLAVVAVVLFGRVQAQTDITVGPKLGFNVTNITNSTAGKNKISFHLGGFAEFKFNNFWAIQPEILYSRQGYRTKVNDIKGKHRVNYLNVPVLAKIYVMDVLSVDFGPQFGFALNDRYKSKVENTTTKTKIKDFNVFDLSFAIGASYELDMGLMLSLRYNWGLTNVHDNWEENNKNHVFQLSAGWRFSDLF